MALKAKAAAAEARAAELAGELARALERVRAESARATNLAEAVMRLEAALGEEALKGKRAAEQAAGRAVDQDLARARAEARAEAVERGLAEEAEGAEAMRVDLSEVRTALEAAGSRLKARDAECRERSKREKELSRQVKQLEEQRDAHVRHSELLLKDKYLLLDQLNSQRTVEPAGSPRSPGARRPLSARNSPSRSGPPVSPKEAVAMAQRLRETRRG